MVNIDVDVGDTMAFVLEPFARDCGVVVGAETGSPVAMRVVEAATGTECVQGRAAFNRLSCDEAGPDYKGCALMEQIRDGVVRGSEAGGIDFVGRGFAAPHRIAELPDERDVLR